MNSFLYAATSRILLTSDDVVNLLESDAYVFVYPILLYPTTYHVNSLMALGIYDIDRGKTYWYNIEHPDFPARGKVSVLKGCTPRNVVTLGKYLLTFWKEHNIVDLRFYHFFRIGEIIKEFKIPGDRHWKNIPGCTHNAIPFLKIQEHLDNVIDCVSPLLEQYRIPSISEWEALCREFIVMECNGVHFKKTPIRGRITDHHDVIYSDYDVYTSTTRARNRVSWLMSMRKNGDRRKQLCSRHRNGKLFEFDFINSQVSFLAYLSRTKIPRYYYKYISDTYNVPIENVKKFFYKNFYGSIEESVLLNEPLFHKKKELENKYFQFYLKNGYVLSPLTKHKIFPKKDMTPPVLLSYVLQSMETEYSLFCIKKINQLLKNNSSKLILFLYDSFLFDIDLDTGSGLIEEIISILSNQYVGVRVSCGDNFGEMQSIY